MSQPLFEGFDRTDRSLQGHSEPYSRYIDRLDLPAAAAARSAMNEWFGRYCDEGREDLRSRLSSTIDGQYMAAFWELYLHESLLRSGYEVQCHPSIAGTNRRPDFLVLQGGRPVFYLEATSTNGSQEDIAAEARLGAVYDAVGTVDSDNFFTWVQVESQGTGSPSTTSLRAEIALWLASLDPDVVAAEADRDPAAGLPEMAWSRDGWAVTVMAVPKKPEARGVPVDTSLGAWGPNGASALDNTTPIRKALQSKGSAYGRTLGLPYVVAIRTEGMFTDSRNVVDALYGSEQVSVRMYDDGRTEWQDNRAFDGYWRGPNSWRHSHVSAVLIGHEVGPGSYTTQVPTVWLHPEAVSPFAPLPAWATARVADGQISQEDTPQSLGELFGVDDSNDG